jgi:multidrug efflux pump subunit AcrA (membrane-fusion protein)
MEVRVRIDSLDRETTARIEEIAPVADPESRTFLLKAGLELGERVRPGMFGRFIQPCCKKTAFLVPASAILRSGQLEMVQVVEDAEAHSRHIRTGKSYGNLVEVLSGLREGEMVLQEGK